MVGGRVEGNSGEVGKPGNVKIEWKVWDGKFFYLMGREKVIGVVGVEPERLVPCWPS